MTFSRARSRTLPLLLLASAALVAVPWAMPADAQSALIEYEVLSTDTEEPIAITVADDGRVIWTEREGAVKILTTDGEQILAGRVPVSGNLCTTCVPDDSPKLEEGGLYGILLAKDFNTTGRLYLYYAVPGSRDEATQLGLWRLSIFVLDHATNQLDLDSEEPILEVPVHWDHCCHYGGDLDYLPDGTILLPVGDDIPASSSEGYGPRDNTETWLDGELYVQNPADMRGKILRLMPDGSVPDGSQPGIEPNPFVGQSGFHPYVEANPADDPLRPWIRSETGSMIPYNPYIYAIGFKQPFKGSVNPYTGHGYYGDVGPDATQDDPERGPRGHDERNVIPPGGGTNYGWPRCVADNQPYIDVDWTTMEVGEPLDCSEMTPASFYYPKDVSFAFPTVTVGGVTGLPAAFYRADTEGALRLPALFNDTVIDLEFMRSWFATFNVGDDGSLDPASFTRWELSMFYNSSPITGPIDAAVGPDGAVYVAEYGVGFYSPVGSRIGRVKCLGCTPDPADYQVDGQPQPEPTTPPQPEPTAAPGTGGDEGTLPETGGGPWVLLAVLLAAGGLTGLRLRRSIV
ncbi:MAG: PQQ-dependent sugar dehydrogenase [Nitriliruptorales bacterium]|nr:PQQ-dependent sugar dehydrogenase [Nitriliruptorales bacterium]